MVGILAIGGCSWGYYGSAHGYTYNIYIYINIYNTMVKVNYSSMKSISHEWSCIPKSAFALVTI